MAEESVVLVIPAYNEESRLAPGAFTTALDRCSWLSFVFVNDGSSDGTARVLEEMAAGRPRARVVSLPRNQGKAEAVRLGVMAALQGQPDWVGYWDADLATPLEALSDFVALARARPEVEIILGSRVKVLGRDIQRRAARHYFGRFFATAASVVLRLPVYDTQCGAKLFRAAVARAIFEQPFVSRWVFDVELLARYFGTIAPADTRSPRVYELVLRQWHYHRGSKVGLMTPLRALVDLGRIASARRR